MAKRTTDVLQLLIEYEAEERNDKALYTAARMVLRRSFPTYSGGVEIKGVRVYTFGKLLFVDQNTNERRPKQSNQDFINPWKRAKEETEGEQRPGRQPKGAGEG